MLSIGQQRAQGPRPAQSAPKFLILQPAHSLRPLPPQPSTPAAPATLSSLQRGQTIFPHESSRSLPDCFYILGSKFPARRPHPILDVLSPTSRSDPLFPGGTPPCAIRTPSCAHHAALHPPFPLLGAFISTPHSGCAPFSPRARRRRPPPLLPSLSFRSIPSSQFKSRTPWIRRRVRHQVALVSPKFGTYCLLLGPPLGRASGGRWPLRGAGAGDPQS